MVITVTITGAAPVSGDTITVVYGDTSGGAQPGAAATPSGDGRIDTFTTASDTDGDGTFAGIAASPTVTVNPAAIDHYTVTSTFYTQLRGLAFTVTVTAYDQYDNMVTTDSTTLVTMSSSSATMAFDGDGNGTFGEAGDDIKMLTAGTFDIQARDTSVGAGVTITATDPNTKKGTSSPYTIYVLGGGGGGGGAPAPPPPPPPPSPPPLELEVNLWDDVTSAAIDEDGVLAEDITATSPDGMVSIDIAQGTQVLGPDGGPLAELTVETISEPPDAPEGHHIVSAFDFGPDDSSFDPSLEITIEYDPEALPEGVDEASLLIAYYDEAAGEWVFVPGEVDPATNTVTFSAAHFTAFALLAAAPAPAPAPTPTPTPTPAAGLGLGTWTWAGIGIGVLALIGLPIWLIIRRHS